MVDDDVPDGVPSEDEIAAMPAGEHKVYENRIRRIAARRLLRLRRTRRRDPGAHDFGVYRLEDARGRTVASGTLRQVHLYLLG